MKYSPAIKDYLFEIAKIIEGATNADYEKVAAYSKQLTHKLEADGESDGATRIRQILDRSKIKKLGFARASNARSNATPGIPVDLESRMTLADEEHLPPGSIEIFLSAGLEQVVSQFLNFYRASDRLVANGVGISASMLLHGPPGCGKTQLAKFVAAELNLPLIVARTDGLISSYLGSTAKNLRMLFEHASSRPCVLFLDEFDALAKMRDDTRELGELKRVVISLLQNIDSMGRDHVLLAATNHDHLLDPAVWRRFSFKLKLETPDQDTRRKMLDKYLANFINTDTSEILAAITDGWSGAQIRETAEGCIRQAVLDNKNRLAAVDVLPKFVQSDSSVGPAELTRMDQVKLIRKLDKRKFTQVRLAQIFSMSQSQVSKILKEESTCQIMTSSP